MKAIKLHPADLGFIAIVAVYILICWLICLYTGHADRFMPLMYLGTAGQITFTFLLGYILYRLCRAAFIVFSSLRGAKATKQSSNKKLDRHAAIKAARDDDPLMIIINDLKAGPLRPEIWTRALPLFIAFVFFFSTFTSMKFLIPDIKPFAWDEFFMRTDRFLHLGIDPWRILHPVFGYPIVTKVISFFYILWLPVFFLVLYWQLFRFRDDALRMRFFYTFALTWAINGTFLAIFFSSAGPCYYEYAAGYSYYFPLMAYLENANEHYEIYSVYTQNLLWRHHMDNSHMLGGGISAFPSVHVATVFLFVLMARHIDRLRLYIFGAFFAVIFLGSIHLGWHYAVDGYFSMLVTWILWVASGAVLSGNRLFRI